MYPRDRLPQPLFVLFSGILRRRHMQMQLHFPHVHFPGLTPLSCREYLPVLEVSGDNFGSNAFHELPNGVLHCEDVVSIQVVVVSPWFGNRPQEAVCPVFGIQPLKKLSW